MSSSEIRTDRCFNPFRLVGEKGHRGTGLRLISKNLRNIFPNADPNSKICSECRLKVGKNKTAKDSGELRSHDSVELRSQDSSVNSSNLSNLSDDTCNLSTDNLTNDELDNTKKDELDSIRLQELEELLTSLKEKLSSLPANDSMRISILTVAPLSWSIRKVSREFGVSRRLAQKARDIRNMRGILASVTSKSGKKLPDTTVQQVFNFYNSESAGKLMSGKKDKVSMSVGGKRTAVQKRLLTGDLTVLHQKYLSDNSDYPLSFSAFAKLRPKNCILAGAAGTHSVCVCPIHENVNLMLEAIDIKDLTKTSAYPLANYKDCLQLLMCRNPTPDCHLGFCKKCPDTSELSDLLKNCLEQKYIEDILFSLWTTTDRSNLVTQKLSVDEYVEELCDRLLLLKPHSFLAKQQSLHLEDTKKNLKTGEVLVLYDFGENFCYVIQNAIQAHHFNNDQCSLMPVIYYYREGEELKHKSIIFISECTKHDTVAVHLVQGLLIEEIRKQITFVLKKIIYYSDGARQHFKNRYNVSNLLEHEEDFGVPADSHNHVTAHGKNEYDGLGATFKREAYRASLQASSTNPLSNVKALFNWSKEHFKNIEIRYYSEQMHNKHERHLQKRFTSAQAVPEISLQHGFVKLPGKKLLVKRYSNSSTGYIFE